MTRYTLVSAALADRALAEGWSRHTPVASNHYPDAVHGTREWHSYASGEYESVAVQYPPESDDDATAGLWWVLVVIGDGETLAYSCGMPERL